MVKEQGHFQCIRCSTGICVNGCKFRIVEEVGVWGERYCREDSSMYVISGSRLCRMDELVKRKRNILLIYLIHIDSLAGLFHFQYSKKIRGVQEQ